MKYFLVIVLTLSVGVSILAQQKIQSLEEVSRKHAIRSFPEFYELLSLPNDAHTPTDIEKNVQWCETAYDKRGCTA